MHWEATLWICPAQTLSAQRYGVERSTPLDHIERSRWSAWALKPHWALKACNHSSSSNKCILACRRSKTYSKHLNLLPTPKPSLNKYLWLHGVSHCSNYQADTCTDTGYVNMGIKDLKMDIGRSNPFQSSASHVQSLRRVSKSIYDLAGPYPGQFLKDIRVWCFDGQFKLWIGGHHHVKIKSMVFLAKLRWSQGHLCHSWPSQGSGMAIHRVLVGLWNILFSNTPYERQILF